MLPQWKEKEKGSERVLGEGLQDGRVEVVAPATVDEEVEAVDGD